MANDHPQARDMLTMLIRLDDHRLDVHSMCEAASFGAAGFLTKDQVGTDLVPLLLRVLDSMEAG